jgi:hypothetical protein
MLMNFETKYKYYLYSHLLSYCIVFFSNIVLTTYSLKHDVKMPG